MSAMACPECGATGGAIWGYEISEVYDGVLYWACSACGHAWARDWTGFGRRQEAADRYALLHRRQTEQATS